MDLKHELDFGMQAAPLKTDGCCQAAGEAVTTAETQHDAKPLTVSTLPSELLSLSSGAAETKDMYVKRIRKAWDL